MIGTQNLLWGNHGIGDSVDWNDELTTIICKLFTEQVRKENWMNTHLNTVRFAEVPKTFEQKAAKEQVG